MSPPGDIPGWARDSAWPGVAGQGVPGAPRAPIAPLALIFIPSTTGAVPWHQGCSGMGGNIAVVLADAPQKPSFISLVEPRGGRQAVLLCTVDSFPPSDIALHRGPGHAPLASTQGPSDPRFTVQATPNSLRVEMVGLELQDAGVYVCSANNSYGTTSASLRLELGGEGGPEGSWESFGGFGKSVALCKPKPWAPLDSPAFLLLLLRGHS